MKSRTAYSDRETAQWCTQEVVTRNEQLIHRWLARNVRRRLTIEAAWPSRPPVGRARRYAAQTPGAGELLDAHAARVILRRTPARADGIAFTVHATFPIHL